MHEPVAGLGTPEHVTMGSEINSDDLITIFKTFLQVVVNQGTKLHLYRLSKSHQKITTMVLPQMLREFVQLHPSPLPPRARHSVERFSEVKPWNNSQNTYEQMAT